MAGGSRRRLAVALLLAASGGAFAYSPCEDAAAAGRSAANPLKSESGPATLVCNAELATVTDDSAVVTWVTNRSAPSKLDCWSLAGSSCEAEGAAGLYHAVELTALAPGTIYFYRIAGDAPAPPTAQSPGVFRTLDRPGDYLFSFASLNDMHVGETVSGQATAVAGNPIPPSFEQANPPYWRIMSEGAVAAIRQRGVAFTIVKGDLTSDGGKERSGSPGNQFDAAEQILAALGAGEVFPVRGNHDKSLALFLSKLFSPLTSGATLASTNDRSTDLDPHYDFSFDWTAGGEAFHFVALDTWDNDMPLPPPSPLQPPNAVGGGRLTADQLDWLDRDLAANAAKRTFVSMHHPSSELASLTAVPPVIFAVRQPDSALFLQRIAAHANVVAVLSGHTHRNWITESALAPGVPFAETAAAKEYPGGYALYKVFTGGYVQAFYKCTTPGCLAWSEQTRGEYLNLYPLYASQTGARNGCFGYDFATRRITTPELR